MECDSCGAIWWYKESTRHPSMIECMYCNTHLTANPLKMLRHIEEKCPKGVELHAEATKCICKDLCRSCCARQSDSGQVYDSWTRYLGCRHSYCARCMSTTAGLSCGDRFKRERRTKGIYRHMKRVCGRDGQKEFISI